MIYYDHNLQQMIFEETNIPPEDEILNRKFEEALLETCRQINEGMSTMDWDVYEWWFYHEGRPPQQSKPINTEPSGISKEFIKKHAKDFVDNHLLKDSRICYVCNGSNCINNVNCIHCGWYLL